MTITSRGAVSSTQTAPDVSVDRGHFDAMVREVAANADRWAMTPPAARVALLNQLLIDITAAAPDWLADACAAKGIAPDSPEAGEELFAGVGTFVRMVRVLRDAVSDIDRTGRPQYPGPVTTAADGRLRVRVFPASTLDRLVFAQTTANVWMQPGVTRGDIDAGQAGAYRDPAAAKGVSLVLGAGNVASLGPRDVLSKLFVEGKVVVLKANPVNDYLVPHWSRAMKVLVELGVLRIVAGGADVGAYLTNHDAIDEVHITGSDKTHDAIVFGVGPDGAARKAAGQPLLTKPVTSELGNVSPVIVVPGNWSAQDLDYQAKHVATMLTNNAGFNCLTARVIVTHAGWPQRTQFLDALARVLGTIPTRHAYYPGASDRRDTFVAAHPDAVSIGSAGPGVLPWTLIPSLDATASDDVCFNVEAFCGLCSETSIAASSPAAFLDAAVEFCNDVLWGTLSATVIVHPSSRRDGAVAAAVDRAVADLRYGGIGVNLWHGFVFALGTTTWGAYPGHPINDIQSGSGVVGNAYMFDRPQKSVVSGPFRARPAPPWFATNRHQLAVMRHLVGFEADPSWRRIPGLLAAAMRSS